LTFFPPIKQYDSNLRYSVATAMPKVLFYIIKDLQRMNNGNKKKVRQSITNILKYEFTKVERLF